MIFNPFRQPKFRHNVLDDLQINCFTEPTFLHELRRCILEAAPHQKCQDDTRKTARAVLASHAMDEDLLARRHHIEDKDASSHHAPSQTDVCTQLLPVAAASHCFHAILATYPPTHPTTTQDPGPGHYV